MTTASIDPRAGFSWDAIGLDFLADGAEFALAAVTAAVFDFMPYGIAFEPGGTPDNFLTSDGEILSSDGETLQW